MAGEVVYCVDTSTFIDLARLYPETIFPSLWKRLADLIRAERVVAPVQVLREIEVKSDALARWAKRNRRAFLAPDADVLALVPQVLARFQGLVDSR